MISDNYVTGDNVFLRELQNFFFEVLGMMSVTHYGAIGDGRTDNYAALQVAIDDANRRGLSYIYVPYGRYRYRGELINRENITFIGNPRAKIFNDRTGEEIEVKQFGWADGSDSYTKTEADGKFVFKEGDTLTGPLAIGETSTASGLLSFAQGTNCTASGEHSNATGYLCTASGNSSHAEGDWATASGLWSHAEGHVTTAIGDASHAGGMNTQATRYGQTAIGVGNVVETGDPDTHDPTSSVLVAGNGVYDSETEILTTSNAFKVQFNGDGWFSGNVYVGSTSGTDRDSGSKKLATEEYVDTHMPTGSVYAITAALNQDYTFPQDGFQNLDLVAVTNIGNKFSIAGSRIYVGSGINYVKVSANACWTSASQTSSTRDIQVSVSGHGVAYSRGFEEYNQSIPTFICEVEDGDYIQLNVKGFTGDEVSAGAGSGGAVPCTWITVEAIG